MFGLFNKKKPVDRGAPIIVVSGLPRSGTSMAMKMLDAAGFHPVQDDKRQADEDNPKGYYEDERVLRLNQTLDRSWLFDCRGKALKVVSHQLKHLPGTHDYRILFMRRSLDEIVASQNKMLVNRDETERNLIDDEGTKAEYERHLAEVYGMIEGKEHFQMVEVQYRGMIDDPQKEAQKIKDFLGGDLDLEKMTAVVDGKLYRNRAK
ncbi:MAG: sulfotransferase domain-containing protein [Planctomycetota bacterium]